MEQKPKIVLKYKITIFNKSCKMIKNKIAAVSIDWCILFTLIY